MRRKWQLPLFFALALALAGCTFFGDPSASKVGNGGDSDSGSEEVDFDFSTWFVSEGSGEWSLYEAEESAVIQAVPAGGSTFFRTPDTFELPDEFTFSAELGIIEGNDVESRPFVGIGFHVLEDDEYVFRYREGSDRYELAGSDAEHYPSDAYWEWDLKEWREFVVVRTNDRIQTYADGALIHDLTNFSLAGGGLSLWTFNTATIFRNISFIPEAVPPEQD